jgi:apolipoprotein N-acyltransferase
MAGWLSFCAAFCAAHPKRMGLLAGLILPLAFAPFQILPIFYLSYGLFFWLAWQGRETPKRLFVLGWVFGFGQFFTGLLWVGEAFLVEAEHFLWALPFAVTLLPAGLALFGALALWLWGHLMARFAMRRLLASLSLALLLVLAAYLRGTVFTGLPWNLPAMGWGSWLYLAQAASFIGVHGLGLVALVSVALLMAERAHLRWMALGLGLLALLIGVVRLHGFADPAASETVVTVVQPNISQREKWLPEKREDHIETILKLTQLGLEYAPKTNLILWPETAIPALIDEGTGFADRLRAALPALSAEGQLPPYILTGAVRREVGLTRDQFYNSAMLWSGDGHLLAKSDKHHLVPFGEYLPLQDWLEAIGLQQLVRLPGGYDYGPPHARLSAAGLPILAPLICYEGIFPTLSASPKGVARPDVLVNITNDGWFGNWHGPHQHIAQVRLRAIEQGLPLVRSANTGISAVFDAKGRQLEGLPLGEAGVFSLPLPSALAPSVYARFGDSLFFALWLSLALVIVYLRPRRVAPAQ